MALVLADALLAHKAQCELFPVGPLEGIYPQYIHIYTLNIYIYIPSIYTYTYIHSVH
jgi:hypothetical protein